MAHVIASVADDDDDDVLRIIKQRIDRRNAAHDALASTSEPFVVRELWDENATLVQRLVALKDALRECERQRDAQGRDVVALEEALALARVESTTKTSAGEGTEVERERRLKEELSEVYKKHAESSQRFIDARDALEKEQKAKKVAEDALDQMKSDVERAERRAIECEHALAEARKAESSALSEAEAQLSLKNAALTKIEQLERDNAELLERLMEVKMKEAEKMNEINDLYADMLRQKKSAELSAKAEGLADASAASLKALSMSTMMSNGVPSRKKHILQANKGGTHRVALSHDSFTLACAGDNRLVSMFDVETGAHTSDLSGMLGSVLDVCFSVDYTMVLGASTDCSLQLWDALSGRVKHRLTGHAQKVTSAKISQIDAKRAVSCSQDRNIKVWDLNRGHALSSMLTPSNVYSVAFDSSEQHVCSGHFDGSVRIWDVRTNDISQEFSAHTSIITAVTTMPNQNELLTNSRDNTLKLLDIRTLDVVRTFSAPKYRVGTDWSNPCVSPDGQHIASGGADGGLFIWRVQDGRLMTTLHGHDAVVATCAWSTAGLASACKNGVCLLWV